MSSRGKLKPRFIFSLVGRPFKYSCDPYVALKDIGDKRARRISAPMRAETERALADLIESYARKVDLKIFRATND